MIRLITQIGCALTIAGCATTLIRGTPASAQQQYDVAMDDLDDGLYPEAISGFTELKTKFPYSSFAALADLRIADTHFERGKFVEAIDSYRSFLKFHPSHQEAAYAMFRISEGYFEQIPKDWWFLPPSAEKDQASTRMAISAYRDMISRYPKSEHTEVARKRLDQTRRKLADHEIYVARFYFQRDRYSAAARRAENLLRDYPGLGLDSTALLLVAQSRYAMNDKEVALAALLRLAKEFPESGEAVRGANLLDTIRSGGKPEASTDKTVPQES